METVKYEEGLSEPLSPTGQYLSTSVLCFCVIGVLEIEIPFDDSQALTLLKDMFLPINPRFSSIMVKDKNGGRMWKAVDVNLEDHVRVPVFPPGISYDESLDNYLSDIQLETLPETRPLWEVHIIKYPTKQAQCNIIFKIHHALGDGFSLMGALLSCLQRADNPALPLTFPSRPLHIHKQAFNKGKWRAVTQVFSSVYNTITDFWSSVIQSSLIEDDKTPIRSGQEGVEFLPVSIATISLSIDHVKDIKNKIGVTLNDIVSGTLLLGTRLYMKAMEEGSEKASATSLVLLNTRMVQGYKSIKEMVKPGAELPWGNHFAFLSVPIPKLRVNEVEDPLRFVQKANEIVQRKRTSFAVFLTARFLQLLKKYKGPEAAAKCIHGTLKNTSIAISNVMGPVERMSLANHPVKGLYFVVSGVPQSLMVGVISYMGQVRLAVQVQKDFIHPHKLKSYIEKAFAMIFEAACGTLLPPQ